jgi:pimeloyl-ACP methyl ester carboxylesterase
MPPPAGPPTVVLVPGLGLGPEAWERTLRHLDGSVSRQVVSLEGYGVPARRCTDLDPKALATRLIDELPDHPVVLAGHSASCQVVAHAAAMAPNRVAGLVLVGPTTDPRAQGWPRLAARWLATAAHEDPRQVPSLVRQYHRTTLLTMASAMDQARFDRIDRVLARVVCPVLVLRGTHDRICPLPWASVLGTVLTLDRGGHMIPLTHGRPVATALAEFVARVARVTVSSPSDRVENDQP